MIRRRPVLHAAGMSAYGLSMRGSEVLFEAWKGSMGGYKLKVGSLSACKYAKQRNEVGIHTRTAS